MNTPVVLLIYKREECTKKLITALREVAPTHLYIVADGAKPGEEKLVAQTRNVIECIDWPCKIEKIYAAKNLGLRERVVSGLNTVFAQEETVIILEDDCIPDPSFFPFCETLLKKYQDNPLVVSISGANALMESYKPEESYYFSRYFYAWGWATWRRAWQEVYDPSLSTWPSIKAKKGLKSILHDHVMELYWSMIFSMQHARQVDSWAYGFEYGLMTKEKLAIIATTNLVTNIGEGEGATHTKQKDKLLNQRSREMTSPLIHPAIIARDQIADQITEKHAYLSPLTTISLVLRSFLGISKN